MITSSNPRTGRGITVYTFIPFFENKNLRIILKYSELEKQLYTYYLLQMTRKYSKRWQVKYEALALSIK
jgi:hypothetical protein